MITRLRRILVVFSFVGIAAASCSSNDSDAPNGDMPVASGASACDGGASAGPPSYDPIPASARGPALTSAGYLVQEVKDKLYWLTDGIYSCMFLSTGSGVIVVDVPQTIAPNLIKAIASVTAEPITHVVYSHHHADHIGGAAVIPKGATFIAQENTASLLAREADPNRPVPTVTFTDTYTLTVGSQTLVLDYKGPNHDVGNIFIYAPAQKVLMLVDVIGRGGRHSTNSGRRATSKGTSPRTTMHSRTTSTP